MDTFDAIIEEAARSAESTGTSFDAALASVLSDAESAAPPDVQTVSVQNDGIGANNCLQLVPTEALAEAIKLAVPMQARGTLLASDWEASGDDEYPYSLKIRNAAFASSMRTDVYVDDADIAAAQEAGVWSGTNTQDGYVELRAKAIPKTDLNATLVAAPVLRLSV